MTLKELLTKLRAHVAAMGRARLGFGPLEIGTHSIRSAAAMSMFLADVPVYTIMLLGRWSSDAFLLTTFFAKFSSSAAEYPLE